MGSRSRRVGEEKVADSYGGEGGKEEERWNREGLLLIRHGFQSVDKGQCLKESTPDERWCWDTPLNGLGGI